MIFQICNCPRQNLKRHAPSRKPSDLEDFSMCYRLLLTIKATVPIIAKAAIIKIAYPNVLISLVGWDNMDSVGCGVKNCVGLGVIDGDGEVKGVGLRVEGIGVGLTVGSGVE